ncbi:MAG TPA: hypothetical protein VEG61_00510 [Candidatus Dormibacteraeota bacterium]|nr:hypothetical protein [Candidatus Dormibacteraeota bacterium]
MGVAKLEIIVKLTSKHLWRQEALKMDGKRITAALTSLVVASIVGVLADDLSHFSMETTVAEAG